jgi:hypothetical protein
MYEKHNWEKGEVIASELLNNIEIGIEKYSNDLTTHTENSDIHITELDRISWDAKLQASDIANYITRTDFTKFLSGKEITVDGNVNFIGKVKGSVVENPHSAYFSQTADVPNPPINTGEISTANYTNIATNDGKLIAPSVNVATRRVSLVAQFDVVSDIDRNNPGLFDALGATTQSIKKLLLLVNLLTGTIRPVAYAMVAVLVLRRQVHHDHRVNMQIHSRCILGKEDWQSIQHDQDYFARV